MVGFLAIIAVALLVWNIFLWKDQKELYSQINERGLDSVKKITGKEEAEIWKL